MDDVVEKPRPWVDQKLAEVVEKALPWFCERKYEAEVVLNARPTDE